MATIHRLNKEVLVTGTPVFDEEKNIRLVVTNTRDFPELKRLEAQLLALEEKQEKAVQELAYLRSQQAGDKQTIYHSAAMREVMEIVRKVAPTDVTVLITGESGTVRNSSPTRFIRTATGAANPLSNSTVPLSLLNCWSLNYSDMRRGPLRGPNEPEKRACSSWPIPEFFFWMRLGICPWHSRPSCSGTSGAQPGASGWQQDDRFGYPGDCSHQ